MRRRSIDQVGGRFRIAPAMVAGTLALTAGVAAGVLTAADTWEDCWRNFIDRLAHCNAEQDPVFREGCFRQAHESLKLCTSRLPPGSSPGNCQRLYDQLVEECKQRHPCDGMDDCHKWCEEGAFHMWKWCEEVVVDSLSWSEHPDVFSLQQAYQLTVTTEDPAVDTVKFIVFNLGAAPDDPFRIFEIGNAELVQQYGQIGIWRLVGNVWSWPPAALLHFGQGTQTIVVAVAEAEGQTVGLARVFIPLE